jgi:hypothetical protein
MTMKALYVALGIAGLLVLGVLAALGNLEEHVISSRWSPAEFQIELG